MSRSIVTGSGNFRIVKIGPFNAIGSRTTWTLDPSDNLAFASGVDVLTILFTLLTICWIRSSSCSLDSKDFSHRPIFPPVSTNTWSGPFTMISVTRGSSTSSCRISRRRKESNNSLWSFSRSPRVSGNSPGCSSRQASIFRSMRSAISSSDICRSYVISARICSRRIFFNCPISFSVLSADS